MTNFIIFGLFAVLICIIQYDIAKLNKHNEKRD